jgi:hypothetical protein
MTDHKKNKIEVEIDKFLEVARYYQFLSDMIQLQKSIKDERRDPQNDIREEINNGRVNNNRGSNQLI